ncbi:MAG: GNAT family N-acetyltransferase, partial [Aggregatilineales bacterium]
MKDFMGKGIMTRAVKMMIDYAFTTRTFNKVIIRAATANTRSRAIPERLGFVQEAILHHEILLRDTHQDAIYYALLRDEWTVTHQQPEFVLPVDNTNAIELRPFETRHAETLFELTDKNREHLRTWLPWLDNTTTATDSEGFIKSGLSQYSAKNGFQTGIWVQGELVGAMGYHYWDFMNKKTEIGYWLSADFTGNGIMTRATKTLVDFAFHRLNMERVIIPCAVGNTKSCAIPQRLGFTHEGVMRQAEWLYDRRVDHNMFAMLKANWH